MADLWKEIQRKKKQLTLSELEEYKQYYKRQEGVTAWIRVGDLCRYSNEYGEALLYYKQATDVQPRNGLLFSHMALCHSKLNEFIPSVSCLMHSLLLSKPFDSQHTLQLILEKSSGSDGLYLRIIRALYTRIDFDQVDPLLQQSLPDFDGYHLGIICISLFALLDVENAQLLEQVVYKLNIFVNRLMNKALKSGNLVFVSLVLEYYLLDERILLLKDNLTLVREMGSIPSTFETVVQGSVREDRWLSDFKPLKQLHKRSSGSDTLKDRIQRMVSLLQSNRILVLPDHKRTQTTVKKSSLISVWTEPVATVQTATHPTVEEIPDELQQLLERKQQLEQLSKRLTPKNTKIIIDTNMWMDNLKQILKIVASNTQTILVPFAVVRELNGLLKESTKTKKAQTVLNTLETMMPHPHLKMITTNGRYLDEFSNANELHEQEFKTVDDLLLNIAKNHQLCLATGDVNLRLRCRAQQVQCLESLVDL
ncbi:hypothetical protein EDD86DRAFT_90701 [Gorgonomyces haynaldii]|nr:hypothetical protein EDD86DRAFT_90701 [Gorgonomyces haynaldii]